jgi:arginyl-tRNA synthetase
MKTTKYAICSNGKQGEGLPKEQLPAVAGGNNGHGQPSQSIYELVEAIMLAAIGEAMAEAGLPPTAPLPTAAATPATATPPPTATSDAALERPREPEHGDWATTIALRLAKPLKRPPREIAEAIAARIRASDTIAAVEIAGPGFINLRLSATALQDQIRQAREQGRDFARVDVGSGQQLNVEFISANPTGPLHVGHGRWAALGDAISRLCEHAGWRVWREFYVNDAGNQMEIFGQSVALRYLELLGEPITMPENCYGGGYVIDIAQQILDEEGEAWRDVDDERRVGHFRERGYQLMLEHQRQLCERIGVVFDQWFSERSLYQPKDDTGAAPGSTTAAAPGSTAGAPASAANTPTTASGQSPIEQALQALKDRGYLYQKDDATWFRSTDFGDDKDRVLVKADGSLTYFAPDIAYHLSKFRRGSDCLVNIWGADHHGYIPRMQAACEALGYGGRLTVVLGQLVNLFRDGEAVRMSKRTGEMVSFEELVDEVGADATKYLMLSRSTDQPIDFDIEVAKRQDASNPVYYVQYAHARICSLLRKAGYQPADPRLDGSDLSPLTDPAELDLARLFSRLPEVIESAARDLAVFRLARYAEELASGFHSFYTRCQVIGDDQKLSQARLYLADATRSVLALTLSLLGVSAPERM